MDWKKELKNNIVSVEQLKQYYQIFNKDAHVLKKIIDRHPMSITRHYLSLIDFDDPDDPIAKMVIPSIKELDITGSYDTSGEKLSTKFIGFQHKYPQTALILSTYRCAAYCRFCFRKRMVGISKDEIFQNIDRAVNYIKKHLEINNVLITGGDPLMLSTKILKRFLDKLFAFDHIDFVRFGTKVPVYLPQRISEDKELLSILKYYSDKKKQIYFVVQIDHPREITPELIKAVNMLKRRGVILNNQTVLMKDINDSPDVLAELQNKLVSIGINPYYVFQCRPVKRVKNHFQIPIYSAYKIVEQAKAKLNGHSKRFKFIMSHKTGKIEIIGIMNDEIFFKYHQAKDPQNNGKLFKRRLNKIAGWLEEFPVIKEES
ncbi:MAG: KamA family radical SAM protein [Candidatus Cloacimonetes bacterium]|nr:KamA family radical SAM protein [Candidatus Cloacimonadota bacterium]